MRRADRATAVVVALLFAVGLWGGSGCSLMFVEGPRNYYEYGEPVTCTSSSAWPLVDGLLAAYQLYRTGFALSASDAQYKGMVLSRPADIGIGAGLFALTASSAVVGFSRMSRCKEASGPTDTPRPRPRRPTPASATQYRPDATSSPSPRPPSSPPPSPAPANPATTPPDVPAPPATVRQQNDDE